MASSWASHYTNVRLLLTEVVKFIRQEINFIFEMLVFLHVLWTWLCHDVTGKCLFNLVAIESNLN